MFIHLLTFIYMKKPDNNKPFPIRLGDEIKPILQQEAVEKERSLHWLIKKILLTYVRQKK